MRSRCAALSSQATAASRTFCALAWNPLAVRPGIGPCASGMTVSPGPGMSLCLWVRLPRVRPESFLKEPSHHSSPWPTCSWPQPGGGGEAEALSWPSAPDPRSAKRVSSSSWVSRACRSRGRSDERVSTCAAVSAGVRSADCDGKLRWKTPTDPTCLRDWQTKIHRRSGSAAATASAAVLQFVLFLACSAPSNATVLSPLAQACASPAPGETTLWPDEMGKKRRGGAGAEEEMACTPDAGAGEADDELERVDVCLRVEDLEKRSVVCAVLPAKNASVLLGLLSEHLPIPELRFLKRVRGARPGEYPEILGSLGVNGEECGGGKVLLAMLGPADAVAALQQEGGGEIHRQVMALCTRLFDGEVPSFPPNTKEQFDAWSKVWPMNFRPPTGGMKKLLAFSADEVRTLRSYMMRALALARQGRASGGGAVGAVIVDPGSGDIVAESWDESHSFPFCAPEQTAVGDGGGGTVGGFRHPLHHAVMTALHRVAEKQRLGGMSKSLDEDAGEGAAQSAGAEGEDVSGVLGGEGGSERGGRRVLGEVKEGQYLCTGYDAFITFEPCPMCAMALVRLGENVLCALPEWCGVPGVIFECVDVPPGGADRCRQCIHANGGISM